VLHLHAKSLRIISEFQSAAAYAISADGHTLDIASTCKVR